MRKRAYIDDLQRSQGELVTTRRCLVKTKVKRIPETQHPRRITRATISRRMLLVPILIESRVPYRCVPSQSSPVCVHTFIRHVTESGFSHEPLPRRQDACRLLPGVCFPMIFLQHYRPVLITNALSLHLHFFLNLMTGTLLFSFDTVSTCELHHLAPERGGSSIFVVLSALLHTIPARRPITTRVIVDITLYPDDPDTWEVPRRHVVVQQRHELGRSFTQIPQYCVFR